MSLSFPEPPPSVEKEERNGGEMEQAETASSQLPPSNAMPDGFHHLVEYNKNEATSSYPPPTQDQQQVSLPTNYNHINSTPQSGYSSPVSQYRQPEMPVYTQETSQDASAYPYPPENSYPPSYAIEQGSYPPPPEAVVAVSHAPAC